MSLQSKTFVLPENTTTAHKIMSECVWQFVKAASMAGHKLEVTVRPAKRSAEASARLHAMLGWLSKNVIWAGKRQSIDYWKRLTTAAWLRSSGETVELLPALDGRGVDVVYSATREMSGRQVSELMEWIEYWAADQGHDLPDYQRDPATGELVEMRRSK